ncbi:transcriptional regulator [Ochrobactrum soli]|uniref:Transcriptional regulator n=1 Tax=Ochrobactrum soli TaxID=2448455 RepID=A0A849KN33_9HYPH|nr:transcriptional regulator [[Ochrobactrum] soli]NNU63101.1 transcriptional regulator [[Ochrobactrum] soli]
MTSFLTSRLQSQALAAFAIREILEKPLVGETPQSRVKQIGLVNILYIMHQAHEPLTLTSVTNFTGLTRGGVIETMDVLVQRSILRETLGKNSMGRGTARQFEFVPEVFSQIRSTN